ncbi:MAG: Smr/MutS family protein [Nitrospirota bacterium]
MKTSKWSFTSFKGLKEALESKRYNFGKKDTIKNKSDEEIFRDAMADVKEIREFREIPPKKPPRIKPRPVQKDNSLDILRQIVNGEGKIRLSDTGEYIEWISPNIRKDIARRLHEGDFSAQDYIDLHGMALSEAEEALCSFFRESLKKQLFCVKVIHGRGLRSPRGPVLKEALKKWLHSIFRKCILAYATAKDCDGGLGATYVILKSHPSISPLTKGGIKGCYYGCRR